MSTQKDTPRMTYTETNAAGLITDKRNISKMLLEYLSREYPAPIPSFSTPKYKQDRQKIVQEFKRHVLSKGKTATFGGPDGFETVEGKMYAFIYDYFLFRSLEMEYKEFLNVCKVSEAEMSKHFGYKTRVSWMNSVGRVKRVAELVIYWRVIRKYVEPVRG